jgi:hypothetical protein
MDDAAIVRVRERLSDLRSVPNHGFRREAARRNYLSELPPFDELHDDEGGRAFLADFVNCADVWMIQRGRRARFAEQLGAARGLRVAGPRFEDFDCDGALQLGIPGAIDRPHPARPEPRLHAIAPK